MVSHHPSAYSDLPLPPLAPSAPPTAGRASSVTSGRSATRRHRHARSHHGGSGSTYGQQNEFPVFAHTGDVEIVIKNASGSRENRYLLHRLILSQNSGFFDAGTRAEWSGGRGLENGSNGAGISLPRINENESVTAGSSSRASSQERRPSFDYSRSRWRYELDWEAAGDDEMPMLVQKDNLPNSIFGGAAGGGNSSERPPPPSRTKPPASSENFFRSLTNFSSLNISERAQTSVPVEAGDEVLKDYDNLFRTMYNYSPSLDSLNIATAYTECKALLHLADMYDALEIVGSRVDHHLLRFGARLFKQIAKYPPSYLKLGYLARSPTIFSEALTHVVGQWPLAAPQLRGQVDIAVMDLIEDKVDEMREMEERVEGKLWRLNLKTSRVDRVTPTSDFLSWLAISLFRHWLAENTTPTTTTTTPGAAGGIPRDNAPPPPPGAQTSRAASRSSSNHAASQRVPAAPVPPPAAVAPPSPGKVYRLLGSSDPSAYLARDELKRFLRTPSPQLGVDLYTRDNLRRLERRVDEIKALAREAVRPLMRNFLELDLRDFGQGGLGYLTCTRVERRDLPWVEEG